MSGTGQAADDRTAHLGVRDVACSRGGRLLFTGLSMDLASGQAALVSGPNGIGKSSLLRMICGLLPVFTGEIDVRGTLAMADERMALDMDRPLGKALGFWAEMDGRADGVTDALATLDLSHLKDVPVRMLSTGQRKRAVLARVMASGASIWLLDEPANGLDTASIALLGGAVERHLWAGGIVVAASHQPLPWDSTISFTLSRPDEPDDEGEDEAA